MRGNTTPPSKTLRRWQDVCESFFRPDVVYTALLHDRSQPQKHMLLYLRSVRHARHSGDNKRRPHEGDLGCYQLLQLFSIHFIQDRRVRVTLKLRLDSDLPRKSSVVVDESGWLFVFAMTLQRRSGDGCETQACS